MGTDRQRFLHDLPTLITFLTGETRVHPDDLMTSVLSFDSEDVKELPPTSVRNGLSKVMVLYHAIDI